MEVLKKLKALGYSVEAYKEMDALITKWDNWYKGETAFHSYQVYNGDKNQTVKRRGLKMAKKTVQTYADLLLNEKVTYTIGEEEDTKKVLECFDTNDFFLLANKGIEQTMALGTGAFVLALDDIEIDTGTDLTSFDKSKIRIDFVAADKIVPLSYTSKKITECAFITSKVIDTKQCVYVSLHVLENEKYVIKNLLYEKKGKTLRDITDKLSDAAQEFETDSDIPWFSILKPNITNSLYRDNPYGVSVYGDSIDVLEGLDISYDSFISEILLGKKRIFLDDGMVKFSVDGIEKPIFDTNDLIFHTLPLADGEEKVKGIHETDFELRMDELEKAINVNLNLLSMKTGLGEGYFKFENGQVKTATEVISEDSDLYRSMKKQMIAIDNCLHDLIKSILHIMKNYTKNIISEEVDISIDFDDSIIEDTTEIKKTALLEYNSGLIDKVQYFMITRKLTEDQAVALCNDISERTKPSEEEPPLEE